jgi:hypothetical protein
MSNSSSLDLKNYSPNTATPHKLDVTRFVHGVKTKSQRLVISEKRLETLLFPYRFLLIPVALNSFQRTLKMIFWYMTFVIPLMLLRKLGSLSSHKNNYTFDCYVLPPYINR